LVGVEVEEEKAERHRAEGRNVVSGDATSPDFWTRAPELINGLDWVLLTLPSHQANMDAALRLREMGYLGRVAATTKYREEEEALKAVGVEHAFNIYTEAGLGFANELRNFVGQQRT
jgi:Trk K+ transport system NAD-binding subunit